MKLTASQIIGIVAISIFTTCAASFLTYDAASLITVFVLSISIWTLHINLEIRR